MDNKERGVGECRTQKVEDKMTTNETSKRSLNNLDDKRFYANNTKSYPHDENLYLFKRNLVNKVCEAGWGRASHVTPTKAKGPSPI